MKEDEMRKYIDDLFQQTYDEYLKDRDFDLGDVKNYISTWILDMYNKDPNVLKEMSKSDDLLKMIQREFRLSNLLD